MKKVILKKKFIAHFSFKDFHTMKYEYTIIKDKKDISKDEKIYQEIETKKINEFEFGDSESIFYFTTKGKSYKSLDEILKSKHYILKKLTP